MCSDTLSKEERCSYRKGSPRIRYLQSMNRPCSTCSIFGWCRRGCARRSRARPLSIDSAISFRAGVVAARNQMPRAAMSRSRGSCSTMAGKNLKICRRSRPLSPSTPRVGSLRATIRPISRSIARSILIAAASTAAYIVSRGRRTPISACRRDWISNQSCS